MADKILPSPALERCIRKAHEVCRGVDSQISYLEDIARVCPEIDPSVTELRVMHEHLDRLCRVGLGGVSADTQISPEKHIN